MKSSLEKHVGDLLTGEIAQDVNNKWLILFHHQKIDGLLPKAHVPYISERDIGSCIDILVTGVQRTPTGYTLSLDRNVDYLLKLTQDIDGVRNGDVTVYKAVRVPGERSKISVMGDMGAFIGKWGANKEHLCEALHDRAMDVIQITGNEKQEKLILDALNLTLPMRVDLDEWRRHALVHVPNDMMGITLGRNRVNLRLAMELLDYKISVQALADDFIYHQEFPIHIISDLVRARLFSSDDLADLVTYGKGKEHMSANTYEYLCDMIEVQDEEEEYECPECGGKFTGEQNTCPHCGVTLEFENGT